MKFMHISDVHLGIVPDAGKSWSEKRAQDIWDTFAEIIEIAAKCRPDFLLISGDLFHAQPLRKELKEINYLFLKIPFVKIVLCAGNHDYLRQKSYYLANEWAENVYFFKREEPDVFDFPDLNTSVYGMSYWHQEIHERIYDKLRPQNPERLNILLAHGGDERHIPFSPSALIQNGFDFVAAGHIHKGGQLIEGKVVMAGSLEPTDCNDTGVHGYWLGEMKNGYADVRFFSIRKCEYCHESYAVSRETTEREVMEWARKLLAERPPYQYFRLYLKGRKDPDAEFRTLKISEMERIVDVTEQLVPDYDYQMLAQEHQNVLLGNYIEAMNRRSYDTVTKKALEYGVNALLGHKI